MNHATRLLLSVLLLPLFAAPLTAQTPHPLTGVWIDPTAANPSTLTVDPGQAGQPVSAYTLPSLQRMWLHPLGLVTSHFQHLPEIWHPKEWELTPNGLLCIHYEMTLFISGPNGITVKTLHKTVCYIRAK